MTMEANVDHHQDASSSADGATRESFAGRSIKKPPGELDLSEDVEDSSKDPPLKKPPGQLDPSDYEYREESDLCLELDFAPASTYTVKQRNILFQKGLDFEKENKPDCALKCYMECIKGLKNKTFFLLLPECLKNMADIYHTKGEYEKAIQFAQAEKLFYETALIETKEMQKVVDAISAGSSKSKKDDDKDISDFNVQAMRADEYEHLAKLCMDNCQAKLGLEYAGKCAKIRQAVYGSNHAKTKEALDFFASLYAKVGKEQYSESLNEMGTCLDETDSIIAPEVVSSLVSGEPVSILRQRTVSGNQNSDAEGHLEKEKKQVRFHESVEENIKRKRKEELVSMTVTLLLLFICFLILASLGAWLYCSMDRAQSCQSFVGQLKSWFRTFQYKLHQHSATAPSSKAEYSR